MKKIVLLLGILVMLICAHVAFGQKEGVITYDVKVNLHRTLPPGREQAKAMIPEFRTTRQQLTFNEKKSLYKPLLDEEDDEESEGGGIRIRMRNPRIETYSNTDTGMSLSKQEFMGKNYLITDTITIQPWKMGTETKKIQGYLCQQAYYTDTTRNQVFTAWFTSEIRSELGPDRFQTLPGTVLALDVNNGERTIVASKIELRPLKKNEIKIPSGGTSIYRAEFRKIQDEQVKKGGGTIIIRN